MKTKAWKKISKVLVVATLCIQVCLCVNATEAQAATKAKVVLEFADGTQETWETGDEKIILGERELAYVYLGEYPQTEIKGKKLSMDIKNAKYNKKGVATVNGVKYKRLSQKEATYVSTEEMEPYWHWTYYDWNGKKYAYFKIEPIKWRVLAQGDNVLLLSEYGLDDKQYNKKTKEITWADCTLRKWLNDDFFTLAFNKKERKLITESEILNEPNLYYGTEGGEDTKDRIFLLSTGEALRYGFSNSTGTEDTQRRCTFTDYARAMGLVVYTDEVPKYYTEEGRRSVSWWLRSPGDTTFYSITKNSGVGTYSDSANIVRTEGSIALIGMSVNDVWIAVRPALNLNLSSILSY